MNVDSRTTPAVDAFKPHNADVVLQVGGENWPGADRQDHQPKRTLRMAGARNIRIWRINIFGTPAQHKATAPVDPGLLEYAELARLGFKTSGAKSQVLTMVTNRRRRLRRPFPWIRAWWRSCRWNGHCHLGR